MRIAQLYHDFRQNGGAERHVQALASELSRRGHEVTIVSRHTPAGFRVYPARFDRWALPLTALRLARWMRRRRIQLIHTHSRIAALLASMAIRFHRVPLVVTSHILPAGFEHISAWGDATICVSEAARNRLIDRFHVPPGRTSVIHNGIESPAEVSPLNPGPAPVISMVARFVPGKGHRLFLDCARRLITDGFPGTFVLAGGGPLLEDFRRDYADPRIVFLGHSDDVPRLLAGSAASVLCSESEAFPYVVLESLAQGTPVLATDCGGPAEAIEPGFNGYLFPIGSVESLARLAAAVSENSGLAPRADIARHCRERFSQAAMVDATVAVYRSLCPES